MASAGKKKIAVAAYCIQCGAPHEKAAGKPARCEYCRSALLPAGHPDPRNSIPCHQCQNFIRDGSSFCPHCGAPAAKAPRAVDVEYTCPACQHPRMRSWGCDDPDAARHPLFSCIQCGGTFVDHEVFSALKVEAIQRATSQGTTLPSTGTSVRQYELSALGKVEYRRCPVCAQTMARRNFAQYSGIIVDLCPQHGIYFDPEELPAVLSFIQSGGLALAQQKREQEPSRRSQGAPHHPAALSFSLQEDKPLLLRKPSEIIISALETAFDAFIHWAQQRSQSQRDDS